jgi:selenocysteine lyase/cysteine desulfurase
VDAVAYERAMDDRVAVASVMWVNNETGVVQEIAALGAAARAAGAVFHTDAVQAFGKVAIDLRTLPVDLLSLSGHKLGAPKGVGALYIRRGTPLAPLFHGGSQDRGRRPGTENVAYAVGLATAAELTLTEHAQEQARLMALRDRLEAALRAQVPDAVIHGADAPRAPHIVNVSIPGANSEALLMALDLRGIALPERVGVRLPRALRHGRARVAGAQRPAPVVGRLERRGRGGPGGRGPGDAGAEGARRGLSDGLGACPTPPHGDRRLVSGCWWRCPGGWTPRWPPPCWWRPAARWWG